MLIDNSANASSLMSGVTSDKDGDSDSKKQQSNTLFDKIMQQVLDNRVGIDSKKLQELKDKIDQIKQDDSLSKKQQTAAAEPLQKQLDQLYKQIAQRLSDQSSGASQPGQSAEQTAKLQPLLDSLKQQLLFANQSGPSSTLQSRTI